MMIYHYTTLDALALILKNQTLLFNRLDCVDDVEEGSVESSGIYIGKYVFVSCWTESKEESIPLWKMYAGDKMGVRIGLEKDMFRKYLIVNPTWGGQQWQGSMILPLPAEAFNAKDHFVLPILTQEGDFFYRKIQYVDDVASKTKDAVVITPDANGKADAKISLGEIGRYKHRRWAFQDETRFVLTILPFNPLLTNPDDVGSIAINSYMQNKPIPFTRYFMHLDPSVLSNIEITLSPNATEGQRVIVESLTRQYAPGAVIKNSALGPLVKF